MTIDPWAYRAFTAPKYALFFLVLPALIVSLRQQTSHILFNWVLFIYGLRVIWLASTNPDWFLHPSNDSFLLTIGIGIWMFAVLQASKRLDVKLFFLTITSIGVLQVGVGVFQLLVYPPDPVNPIKTAFIGAIGTSNGLGLLLVISLFCVTYLLTKFKKRTWLYIVCFILVLGILCSESRGSILVLISVTGIIVLLKTWVFKLLGIRILVISGIMILIGSMFFILYTMDAESSSGRWILWKISWLMIQDFPLFGVGQGNFGIEFLNYQAQYFATPENLDFAHKASNVQQAHNEYLQAFASSGIIGGVLFFLMWFFPLYHFLREELRNKQLFSSNTTHLAIHLSIMLHCLIDSPLHVFPISLIGYANMMFLPFNNDGFNVDKRGRNTVYVAVLFITIFLCYKSVGKYYGQRYWALGAEQTQLRNWEASILHLSKALERLPKQGELMYQLGASNIFSGQISKGLYLTNESKKYFNDKNIYLTETFAHIQQKEYKQAEDKALKALSMFPTQLAPHLLLGEIYYYQGRVDESKDSLQKCIEEDTPIKSPDTKQISEDALLLWERYYGTY